MTPADITSRLIVGFEVHIQLATRTKLFCGCELTFGVTPNSRLCPVCLGLPGALPVMNRRAFELAVRVGIALNCRIAPFTKWDRKGYFYPDLPKNYQISQYDLPLAHDGEFEIETGDTTKTIRIIRAHLEEDAGKNTHDPSGHTLVDLNRAGTPLLEVVTEPDIGSADEAYVFCTELRQMVLHLEVSHSIMQRGQMRFEPNINVAITADGREYRTPISEIKNLNSFRAVRLAIEYEHKRQVQDWLADSGYLIKDRPNENRGWDDDRGVTVFQRGKEAAHDYRYFPDPDLVPVKPDPAWLAEMKTQLPELPARRRRRLVNECGVSPKDAQTIVSNRATAILFDETVARGAPAAVVAKQFVNVWTKLANDRNTAVVDLGVDAQRLARLAELVDQGTISASAANRIAGCMVDSTETPDVLAESMGLVAVLDIEQTNAWVDEAITANEKAVRDALSNPKKFKAAVGFLRGQVMKLSGGKANPGAIGELIEARLSALQRETGPSPE